MNIDAHLQQFQDEADRQAEEAKRYERAEKDENERIK